MSKKEFKCEKCGETMSLDTSVVLTSYPAMYTCFCENCGHIQYIYCSEQNNYKWKRIKTELYEHKQECEVADVSNSGNQTITGNKLCVDSADLGITSITQTLITQFYNEKEQYMIDNLLNDIQENKDKYKGLTIIPIKREQVVELLNKGKEYDNLKHQLAEKDKEIEKLKQCVMSKEQVEAIMRPEISNLTEQITKEITPIIYKECRHQICEKIREFIEQPENSIFYDASLYVETEGLRKFLDQIEKGE